MDAMILPGGESTTMLKFLQEEGLEAAAAGLAATRRRFLWHVRGRDSAGARGARSGASVAGIRRSDDHAQRLRAAASERSAQRAVEAEGRAAGDGVHSRAVIETMGPGVEVLASEGGRPVLVRRGGCWLPRFIRS